MNVNERVWWKAPKEWCRGFQIYLKARIREVRPSGMIVINYTRIVKDKSRKAYATVHPDDLQPREPTPAEVRRESPAGDEGDSGDYDRPSQRNSECRTTLSNSRNSDPVSAPKTYGT